MKKLIKPVEIVVGIVVAVIGLLYGIKRFAVRIDELMREDEVEDGLSPVVMPLPPEVVPVQADEHV